ncbi:MAG: hypothetical protein ACREBH_01850 [Candidatus Micrarchaeaceae archaeon]
MPRTNNKSAAKSTGRPKGAGPNALRFIASLLFLFVIFGGSSAGMGWWSPYVISGAGSLWLPILLGAAVLSSIALFFSSIAGLVLNRDGMMGGKLATVAAFTLIALTVSTSWTSVFWVVVVGFMLSWVAGAMEAM